LILEVAVLNVRPGLAAEFEAAFAVAAKIISKMSGYINHELQRCLEVENRYVSAVGRVSRMASFVASFL
jgi:heme-degrading monooxygenase HmoA